MLCPFYHVPLISRLDSFSERNLASPAQRIEPADIQEFAGSTIRFRVVITNLTIKLHDLLNELTEFAYSDIFANTDIDHFILIVVLHNEQACIREIIHMEKFSPRRPRSPDPDDVIPSHFRIMKFSNQRGECMARLEIELVSRSIHIGRHD